MIIATYRTGAEIKRGSFVPEQPSEAELARRAALESSRRPAESEKLRG